jgi:hypothetical protein
MNNKNNNTIIVENDNEDFVKITDYGQSKLTSVQKFSFLNIILVAVTLYWFYINTPTDKFYRGAIALAVIFLVRHVLTGLTTIEHTHNSSDTTNIKYNKYYQINLSLAFAYIFLIISMSLHNSKARNNTLQLLFAGYALFLIGSKHVYTSDALFTVLLAHVVYKLVRKKMSE